MTPPLVLVLRHRLLAQTVLSIVAITSGCMSAATPLQRLAEARQLAADLSVQFTKAAAATNRAVMANTADASRAFSREAEEATQAAQTRAGTLRPLLEALGYPTETRLLDDFASRFADYWTLDATIRELAAECTNLEAKRLSFGPSREAADAISDALEAVVPLRPAEGEWRIKGLAVTVLAEVREIQVLQAPHIDEADDDAMTRIEKRMAASEAAARTALQALTPLVNAPSQQRLAAAREGLDRFVRLNGEIVKLSRRNTNVRSLSLSLGQKRVLTAACDESLRQLQEALAQRGFGGTR